MDSDCLVSAPFSLRGCSGRGVTTVICAGWPYGMGVSEWLVYLRRPRHASGLMSGDESIHVIFYRLLGPYKGFNLDSDRRLSLYFLIM